MNGPSALSTVLNIVPMITGDRPTGKKYTTRSTRWPGDLDVDQAGEHQRHHDEHRQQQQQHPDVLQRPDEAFVVPQLAEVVEADVLSAVLTVTGEGVLGARIRG